MKSILYKTVYKRKDTLEVDHITVLKTPHRVFELLGLTDYKEKLAQIKSNDNKEERNQLKRDYLPAVDVSPENILTIDIDDILDGQTKKDLISLLSNHSACYAIMESVSGNLVAYFKYECDPKDYKYIYYKLYLELTLILGIDIDFLPERNRLRYVSMGELYYFNEESEVLTEMLKVEKLPHINRGTQTQDKEGRTRVVYKSN